MRILRKLLVASVLSGALALAIASNTREPEEFETVALSAHMDESPDGQKARDLYPTTALSVFALFGHTEEFARVLRHHGPYDVVPLVTKCLTVGDSYLSLENSFGKGISSLLAGKLPTLSKQKPEECAWAMILAIDTLGHEFLNQYLIEDGVAKLLPGSATAAAMSRLATSNLRVLERKLVMGKTPAASEWALALVDIAGMSVAGKGASLATKLRAGSFTSSFMRAKAASVGVGAFVKAYAPSLLKYGAFASVPYIAWKHPQVLTSAGGFIADAMGIPRFVGEVLVWLIPFLALYLLLAPLWLPVRFGYRMCKGVCRRGRESWIILRAFSRVMSRG